ncbi:MAG: mucoidy inhibitor MuiA family protein [Filomicrobium sp.]
MKGITLVLGLACVFGASIATLAVAADQTATSAIDSVTVFPSGAEIKRTSTVKLTAGETTLIFPDLPAETVAGSIRIDGEADADLTIGSVDQRRLYVPQGDQANNGSERKRIEEEIEKLQDERRLFEGRIEASETRRALLKNLANLPNVPQGRGENGQTAAPDWPQLLGLISTGITDVNESIVSANVAIRDTDRKISDLQRKLNELSPKRIQRTEVKVHLTAASDLEAKLTISYQVRTASWVPSYEARLQSVAEAGKPNLTLIRRAAISQRTGEDWKNVAIKLSTTRPRAGSSAPNLPPLIVDFRKPVTVSNKRAVRQRLQTMADEASVKRGYIANNRAAGAAAPAAEPAPRAAKPAVARIQNAPFQAIFVVPGRTDVPSTNERKTLQVTSDEINARLRVKSVPQRQAKAYLYAIFKLQADTPPMLPGAVSLFRDGSFVGKGRLPLIAGEEHELGFGADDLVRIKHAVVKEKRGETGLISTTRTDARNYKITVTNMHKQKIDVTIIDRMPVPRDEKIKVSLTGSTSPTKKDVDDKRGLVAWEFALTPKAEKVIDFGYVVNWPADRKITYKGR